MMDDYGYSEERMCCVAFFNNSTHCRIWGLCDCFVHANLIFQQLFEIHVMLVLFVGILLHWNCSNVKIDTNTCNSFQWVIQNTCKLAIKRFKVSRYPTQYLWKTSIIKLSSHKDIALFQVCSRVKNRNLPGKRKENKNKVQEQTLTNFTTDQAHTQSLLLFNKMCSTIVHSLLSHGHNRTKIVTWKHTQTNSAHTRTLHYEELQEPALTSPLNVPPPPVPVSTF